MAQVAATTRVGNMKRDNSHRVHDSPDESFSESAPDITASTDIGITGPSNGGKKRSARFKDDGSLVEVMFDTSNDSVSIENTAGLTNRFERRASKLGSQVSFKIKQVTKDLKRFTSSKKFDKTDRSKSAATRAFKGLQFMTKKASSEGWDQVEARFDQLAVDGLLLRSRFGKCIGMLGSDEFAGHLLDALARRRGMMYSAVITKDQLREFWEQLTDQSFDSRVQIFFDMVDKNADGRISEEEVKEIIELSASANRLSKIKERVDEYTALIMEELDPDNVGHIELYNLEMLLLQAPVGQSARFGDNKRDLHQLLSMKLVRTKEPNPIKRWYRKTKFFVEDNWKRIWVAVLWTLITVALFTWKFIEFKHKPAFKVMRYCVSVAKGGAEILKFNMALILLTVCRVTLTWLRNRTKLGTVVPFDDSINFHKLVAFGIFIGIALHAGGHAGCNIPRILHSTDAEYRHIAPFFGDDRPPNYWWFLMECEGWTGVTMIVLFVITYVMAMPSFRRNRLKLPGPLKRLTGFNAFWYSHHLFVIVYVLYIIHSYQLYLLRKWYQRTGWMYLTIPFLLYLFERLLRAFRSNFTTLRILKAAVYPGDVLELQFSKPNGFTYKSGQYIFVKCPAISAFQWHPFSITSAPGDDYLSIHIRTLGDWTLQLKALFSQVCQPATGDDSGILIADMTQGNNIPGLPSLSIDGPYGAPSQDYKQYDVLLLVGLGIGATPLISIVKDVLNNIQQQKEELESGNNINRRKAFATSRAYFYWVTREEGSFEWFKGVLNDVTEKDHDNVIELHNYCSSVYEDGDARSALIAMLQSLHHAKSGIDIVSGTNVKTHFARPNWRNVFKNITINHPNQRVGVFYCGAPVLIAELRRLSHDFSRKTTTKFDFHKENF